jgi:hypothetical protein
MASSLAEIMWSLIYAQTGGPAMAMGKGVNRIHSSPPPDLPENYLDPSHPDGVLDVGARPPGQMNRTGRGFDSGEVVAEAFNGVEWVQLRPGCGCSRRTMNLVPAGKSSSRANSPIVSSIRRRRTERHTQSLARPRCTPKRLDTAGRFSANQDREVVAQVIAGSV